MPKYVYIDEAHFFKMAQTLRTVTGDDRTYTPEGMIDKVTTIMDSAMYLLVDDAGNEIPAVFVENETMFDATADDIRLGKVAASQNGVVEGTKDIPNYIATEGFKIIKSGNPLKISLYSNICDYTHMQAIVCRYNTNADNSVSTEKVVINDKVYAVNSSEPISSVSVDLSSQTIDLGLNNDSSTSLVVRYTIIKEES